MKLNLGCGGDIRDGWTNVDLYHHDPRVKNWDVASLSIEPGSVSEILAQDVLEHVSHRRVEAVIAYWCQLLAHGGTITVRCPDARKQAEMFLSGKWPIEIFSYMIYGGQDTPGNFHQCCFTMEKLIQSFTQHGLVMQEKAFYHHDLTSDLQTSSNANLFVIFKKP